MPVQKGRSGERSRQTEQMSGSRWSLFLQQVEKEAQERMRELEAKMENMSSTIDKVFKVELMKMPPSLLKTRMGDLLSEEEISSSEVSIALKNESLLAPPSLRKLPSRRVKSTAAPDCTGPPQGASAKTSRAGRAAKTASTLASTLASSQSAGNLRSSSIKRSRTVKTAERPKPRLRMVASTGDLHCSMGASPAHITVTTAQGQTISFSEENKHDVNLDQLDDVAWCHIQKLTRLMEHLSKKSLGQQ